jgi:hypothetical protein
MKLRICTSKADGRCSVVPVLESFIHNKSQLGNIGFITIEECCSGLDSRSQLPLNFNHRPGNMQQWILHRGYDYQSCVSVANSLECRSEVYQSEFDVPAQAATLSGIGEPMPHILTQERNHCVNWIDCGIGFAVPQCWSWWPGPRTHRWTWTCDICQP